MEKKVDWIIHLVANGATCAECGEKENGFIPYMCNAHTHGMENYNHLNFQLVLNLPPKEIMRILNTFGLMVQDGKTFKNGDMVSGIFEDCQVRLDEFEETDRKVLRVIIPDSKNRFPEDEMCEDGPYKLQQLKTEDLYIGQLKS